MQMKHWLDVRRWPSWSKQAWDNTSASVRVLSAVMWLTGVVLAVLGWIGDSRGFWLNRPFFTNLASSVTAALFGIPFALVILQQITNARASREEARSAQRLAARVSRQMLNAARDMVQPSAQAMAALTKLAEREKQDLGPDKDREAWPDLVKGGNAFVEAGERLWERWDCLKHAMYDLVLETDRRWIESNEVAGLEGFRSGGSWRNLSGDNYAQGNAETILSMVRIIHMIAIDFNRGDPMHLRSSKNGPIPDRIEELQMVAVYPDI